MGIDFSYILYFDRKKQWDALQALVDIALPFQPPTKIIFPDREIYVPLLTWIDKNGMLQYDEPELDLHFSIYFEEDEAIRYYLRDRKPEESFRSPPDELKPRIVSIGFIYLSIYNQTSAWYSERDAKEIVGFNFGTTGTRMSLLFDESTSIRKTFVELLERVPGICGVFNREDNGEVFWYQGQMRSDYIQDPYLLPDEIKSTLNLQD